MGHLFVNVFAVDPKCKYSIVNICATVTGGLGGVVGSSKENLRRVRGISEKVPGGSGGGSGGVMREPAPDPPVDIFI